MKKILFTLITLAFILSAKAQTNEVNKSSDADTAIFTPPKFPGGQEQYNRFLVNTIRYPAIARDKNQQGTVILQMIIEKDGTISNLKIIKNASEPLDKEALRTANLMPKWDPGIYNGKPVRTRWTLPLTFTLARY